MARRKNAEFTRKLLSQTTDDVFAEFGVVDDVTQVQGNRGFVDTFYETLNKIYPGNAIIHIPPPKAIRPKLSEQQQIFVFADYAIRRIAPIAMDAAGLNAEAAKLRKLPEIVDMDTAKAVNRAATKYTFAYDPYDPAYDVGYPAVESAVKGVGAAANQLLQRRRHPGRDIYLYVANTAAEAAKLNPEATWDAVTDMLRAL
jgi:hypothetical protein